MQTGRKAASYAGNWAGRVRKFVFEIGVQRKCGAWHGYTNDPDDYKRHLGILNIQKCRHVLIDVCLHQINHIIASSGCENVSRKLLLVSSMLLIVCHYFTNTDVAEQCFYLKAHNIQNCH